MLWLYFHLKIFVGAYVTEKLEGRLKGIRISSKGTLINEALHVSMDAVVIRCKYQRTLNLSLLLIL